MVTDVIRFTSQTAFEPEHKDILLLNELLQLLYISIDIPGIRPGSRVMGCPVPDNDDGRTAGMVKMMLGKILGVYNRLEKQRSGTVTVNIHPNGIGMALA